MILCHFKVFVTYFELKLTAIVFVGIIATIIKSSRMTVILNQASIVSQFMLKNYYLKDFTSIIEPIASIAFITLSFKQMIEFAAIIMAYLYFIVMV